MTTEPTVTGAGVRTVATSGASAATCRTTAATVTGENDARTGASVGALIGAAAGVGVTATTALGAAFATGMALVAGPLRAAPAVAAGLESDAGGFATRVDGDVAVRCELRDDGPRGDGSADVAPGGEPPESDVDAPAELDDADPVVSAEATP